MVSDHAVRAAENAVSARKLLMAQQWRSLQTRSLDAVTAPATLGTLAVVGAVAGWRAGGESKLREDKTPACTCSGKPDVERTGGTGVIKSVVIGLLRGLATMATEELIRGFVPPQDAARQPQQDLDGIS